MAASDRAALDALRQAHPSAITGEAFAETVAEHAAHLRSAAAEAAFTASANVAAEGLIDHIILITPDIFHNRNFPLPPIPQSFPNSGTLRSRVKPAALWPFGGQWAATVRVAFGAGGIATDHAEVAASVV